MEKERPQVLGSNKAAWSMNDIPVTTIKLFAIINFKGASQNSAFFYLKI